MDIDQEVKSLQSADRDIRTEIAKLAEQISTMQQIIDGLAMQLEKVVLQIESKNSQPTIHIKDVERFRGKLRELLARANMSQNVLAKNIGMGGNVLSDRLNERKGYALGEGHVKSIITTLLKTRNKVINSRAEADELLYYAGFPAYDDIEWAAVTTEIGYELNALDDVTRVSLSNDLMKYDKAQMLRLIESGRHAVPKLRRFILDINITLGLRMQCLDLLFSSTKDRKRDTELIVMLQRDPFREIKIRALKSIAEYQLAVDAEVITETLSRSNENDIILNASRAARYSVVKQGMEPEILVHEKFVDHSEWGVKSNAVKGIIDRDSDNALTLLQHFKKTVTYFKTRDIIASYIESRYSAGTLHGHNLSIAVDMLQSFISDGHSSPQRMKRLEVLLEKISSWSNQE